MRLTALLPIALAFSPSEAYVLGRVARWYPASPSEVRGDSAMSLFYRHPFHHFDHFDRMMDSMWELMDRMEAEFDTRKLPTTAVSVEVQYNDDGLKIWASGVDAEEAYVDVENNVLTLKAKTADGASIMKRAWRLPRPLVDEAQIKAEWKDGVLIVTVPNEAFEKSLPQVKASIPVTKVAGELKEPHEEKPTERKEGKVAA